MASRIDNIAPPGSLFKPGKSKRRSPARPTTPGQRRPSVKDPKHLAAIRQLPCCVPGCGRQAEAAHIRFGTAEKPHTGIGRRPSDCHSLPLCPDHHRNGNDAQHKFGERAWYERHGIDALALAAAIYEVSPDVEAMTAIILRAGGSRT